MAVHDEDDSHKHGTNEGTSSTGYERWPPTRPSSVHRKDRIEPRALTFASPSLQRSYPKEQDEYNCTTIRENAVR